MSNSPTPLTTLELNIGCRVRVLMRGEKELVGILQGFDDYVNIVLTDVVER